MCRRQAFFGRRSYQRAISFKLYKGEDMHWSGGIGPLTPEPARNFADWLYYIGAGISVGMWMYSGYESMSTIAGEIEDPQVISKGTILSVPLIMHSHRNLL